MSIEKIDLTPAVAAELLAHPYSRQRRVSRNKVAQYKRIMLAGDWVDYTHPPILVDKETGGLFNGLQRCSAVVDSGVTIKVLIDREADGSTFDVIDIGLTRSAHQFIDAPHAAIRGSAARIILWYERAFEAPMSGAIRSWQLHEIRAKAEEFSDDFDTWINTASAIYRRTLISESVTTAALAIAGRSYPDAALDFATKLADPTGLDPSEPAWLLFDRMNKTIHRERRRHPLQDWTLLVRYLNFAITGDPVPSKVNTSLAAWPRVGENEASLKKRMQRVAHQKQQRRRIESKVRQQVEAEITTAMAASS